MITEPPSPSPQPEAPPLVNWSPRLAPRIDPSHGGRVEKGQTTMALASHSSRPTPARAVCRYLSTSKSTSPWSLRLPLATRTCACALRSRRCRGGRPTRVPGRRVRRRRRRRQWPVASEWPQPSLSAEAPAAARARPGRRVLRPLLPAPATARPQAGGGLPQGQCQA